MDGVGVQCGDCGAHFSLDPGGSVQGAACSECGGKRFFTDQPSPTRSEMTLRNMVDMDTGQDQGGNPQGEGIFAPHGQAVQASVPSGVCPFCGATDHCTHGTLKPHSDAIGVNTDALLKDTPGAPLTEGTIMGNDGEKPAWKRDNYMHSKVATNPYEEMAVLRRNLPMDVQHQVELKLRNEGYGSAMQFLQEYGQPSAPPRNYSNPAWEGLHPIGRVTSDTQRVEPMNTLNMEPYPPLWDESYAKEAGFAAPLLELAGPLMEGAGSLAAKALPRALPTLMQGALGQGTGQQAGGMAPEGPTPAPSMESVSRTKADIPFLLVADLETPHSVKSVDEQHDDPEDQDQKEFNDGDKSPSNFHNPNNDDSGASGEDGVRDATPGFGFGPDSPGVERANMILPLLLHYFNSDESGESDPLIRALHEALEQEKPGYLDQEHPDGHKMVEVIMQGHKQPHGVHAANTPWDAVRQRYEGRPDWEMPSEGTMMPGEQPNVGTHWYPQGMDDFYEGPQVRDNQMGGYIAPHLTLPPVFPKQVGLGPTRQGGVNAFPSGLPTMPGTGMDTPDNQTAQGTCRTCGAPLAADGSCPNCGANEQQNPMGAQQFGQSGGGLPGTSMPPNAFTGRVGTSGAGPQTDEQKQAVRQLLEMQGRMAEVPLVDTEPWRFHQELNQIQQNPNVAPLVDPSQAQPSPAPMPPMGGPGMPGAPGSMPVMDPSQMGGGGGQPMQPMSHKIALHGKRCPHCDSATISVRPGTSEDTTTAECHSCGKLFDLPGLDMNKYKGASLNTHIALVDVPNPVLENAADHTDVHPEQGQDPSMTWVTEDGHPIDVGQTYSLHTAGFPTPDEVKVLFKKPDELGLKVVGNFSNFTGNDTPDFTVAPQDLQSGKYSFKLSGPVQDSPEQPLGGMPGLEQIPQSGPTTDQSTNSYPNQGTLSHMNAEEYDDICHKCGCDWVSHIASSETQMMHECARCGAVWETKDEFDGYTASTDLSWIYDGSQDDFWTGMERTAQMRAGGESRSLTAALEQDDRYQRVRDLLTSNGQARQARLAGRHFTPAEQRELINERGSARNSDLLDLTNTHYETIGGYDPRDPKGRANEMNAPDGHLVFGL